MYLYVSCSLSFSSPYPAVLPMSFSPETQQIIAEVERLSERPVHVEEDSTLKVLANVTMARGAAPAHFVRYQPGNPGADYLVAFQLGFVVRLFSCPLEARFDVSSTLEEQNAATLGLGMTDLPPELESFLRNSVITQLLTCAVGMRVDRWIRKTFPGLHAAQVLVAKQQLRQNETALNPDLRSRFPKPLVTVNTAMNAAFAAFWATELDEPRLTIPYSVLGADTVGRKLLDQLHEVTDEPARDRDLIDSWAQLLGLTGYYHFKPHTLI